MNLRPPDAGILDAPWNWPRSFPHSFWVIHRPSSIRSRVPDVSRETLRARCVCLIRSNKCCGAVNVVQLWMWASSQKNPEAWPLHHVLTNATC